MRRADSRHRRPARPALHGGVAARSGPVNRSPACPPDHHASRGAPLLRQAGCLSLAFARHRRPALRPCQTSARCAANRALQRPEPWLNEKLENFVARAEALIDAWMSRPTPATRNAKPTGIIVKKHYHIHELTRPTGDDLAEVGVGQAMLPGLKDLLPDYDEIDTFPVLAMFDALRGSDKEAGLGLRMLVTVLTEIDTQISTPINDSGVLVRMPCTIWSKICGPRAGGAINACLDCGRQCSVGITPACPTGVVCAA